MYPRGDKDVSERREMCLRGNKDVTERDHVFDRGFL